MRNHTRSNLIGLMIDPTPHLLVGLLGILKSGHGFVPIDPQQPVERINFILEECEIEILVTQEKYLETARNISTRVSTLGHIICLDRDGGKNGEKSSVAVYDRADYLVRSGERNRLDVAPEETVYAIYTSGSTGTPKCVPISHANLIPLLMWSREYFSFGERTKTLQTLSHWFDFGIFEILTTVLFGGTLYFFDKSRAGDLLHYIDYANRHSINTINSVPSFFREVVAYGKSLPSLEILHLGGEQLTPQLVDEIHAVVADECVLYNGYGPTEASINCSIFALGNKAAGNREEAGGIPIGKPTAANQLYVLDEDFQPVPIGVTGELFVGGAGLSHGYLKRPQLTAEKFVPHPFSDAPGARLYRTGDLVRHRPDGNIEYLGRIDHQVKVRGFRIELGEIETALRGHSSVSEAIVMAREDERGEKRLVAYVVGEPQQQQARPTSSELRSYLRGKLTEYMIPSAFVMLDELPTGASGKVNRRALPAPGHAPEGSEKDYVAPRTPVEELLAATCAEVLGLERLGVNDNLFDLGCHSLLAIKIIARLRETLRADLSLQTFFESPTVAGLAESLEAMGGDSQPLNLPPIQRVERGHAYPLSFAQESVWFLDQLLTGNTSYFIPRAVRFKGRLDVGTVERTFTELVRRHEILRTSFPTIDGRPVQIIRPPTPFSVPLVDLRHLPEEERESAVEQFILEEGQRPFDIVGGPLLRVTVLQLSAGEFVLVLVEHHLVHDGWTQGVLLSEFLTTYSAFVSGAPSTLPELPVQFVDFACWQREWLQGETLEKLLAYWKKQLVGAPPVLHLPADRPRPPVQSFRGAELTLDIPESLADALRAMSRREGVTMFMTMLAVFEVLFRRYTGQEDFCVGTAVANRRCREIEGLLGMLVNTLALRADVSGNPTFRELLGRVRKVCLGAYAHQDMPFEKLVEELQPERDLRYMPLIQVIVAFLDTPMEEMELPGLNMTLMDAHNQSAKFDLNVVFILPAEQHVGMTRRSRRNDISVLFEYNTDIFEEATIERLMGHFRRLLEAVVSDVEQRVEELPMLTPAEERRLLVEWNETSEEYPADVCFQQLFEAQAESRPEAIAAVFENQQLSYGELNARANQLAHYLRASGVGPETRVGLCVGRSPEMAVALVGILKAGGAYVPLDPEYPSQRLAFMLADAQAPILLTEADLVEKVLPPDGVRVVRLDADWELIAKESTENPPASAGVENLAYVIYTSGSTGQPKGVEIAHQSVLNMIFWYRKEFQISDAERMSHVASLSFDAAVWELWISWTAGATIFVASEEVRRSPEEMQRWLIANKITVSFQPTPLAESLLSLEWPATTDLRLMLAGGDKLNYTGAEHRPFMLFNAYGPTEYTVVAASSKVEKRRRDASPPPIGRPLANTQIYILDKHMQPVPQGVAGELYVGGDGLARGYLRRPELTAAGFVPHPFASAPGERLYRTGDVARYLPDGNIEFLGRVDQQVKVRGFRIELGEIEAALRAHPMVTEALLTAHGESSGERRLVAYVVSEEAAEPLVKELREYLKQNLPHYMMPGALVKLDEIPLTPSGKVDWRALPAPDEARDILETSYEAPRTATEEILAGLWSKLLRVERIGVHDNFFELGGHSLLATQALSRTREAFGVEIPLRALFEQPTLEGLAKAVEGAQGGGKRSALSPLLPVPREQALPLSFAQQRQWFISQLEPEQSAYNLPVAARLTGRLDLTVLEQTLSEIVRRHEVLRTTFEVIEGQPVQVIRPPEPLKFQLTDLRSLSADEKEKKARQILTESARQTFDLAHGPLLRAKVLKLDEDVHVVLLTMHHIISDGWSMGILVREIASLYEAYSKGLPSPLPELSIQYADFANWQQQWFRGEVLEEQLAYWRNQLSDAPPVLQLPTDRPRSVRAAPHGASHAFTMSQELTDSVKELSGREGVTPFMLLLAAFNVLLSRYSRQDDISVGTPLANRNRTEIENLIGFFVNTLVLRTDLSGNPSFRTLLKRVRETALAAYAHQDLPFEKLVEEVQPERSLHHTPLFQVMFILQNAPLDKLELPDLDLNIVGVEGVGLKFDLILAMQESDGRISGKFDYDANLFDAATVARMAVHFETLLASIVSDPERQLSALPMLADAEERRLLVEWNGPHIDYPRDKCLHHLFEAQVERTPDAVAVVFGSQQLTYAGLNARANCLANYLRASGVGPETLVGILMERSIEMVVALLGTLKAGGAYVPLDPTYPNARLSFMLEDARVPILLTQRLLAELLPAHAAQTFLIDAEWETVARYSAENLEGSGGAENLAYVIYTSGSTGIPKGVCCRHSGVVNLLDDFQRRRRPLRTEDRCSVWTSLSFDVSIYEIFSALLNGGSLQIVPEEVRADSSAYIAWLRDNRIKSAYVPPFMLRELADWLGEAGNTLDLQRLLVGVEPIPESLLATIMARLPGLHIINGYGPTEVSIIATLFDFSSPAHGQGNVPIGRPVQNTEIYLLDEHQQPVPQGVAGELYVGGDGLARGYLRRPELTAAGFVPHPFASAGGERLYRTGDVARYLPDGQIEFLGRVDQQVKVRGFRIELGEIEAALIRHAGIEEAVVVVREEEDGDKRLIAYLVGTRQPSAGELRNYLRERLPEYMIPSAFVRLSELPQTPNGKVDRRALPAPEMGQGAKAYVRARTPVEEMVAGVWSKVLGVERVGVGDNFFELGGHSLLATQIISRLREAFDVELPLRTLFEYPTVEGFAANLEAAMKSETAGTSVPALRAAGRDGLLPLSFAQERLWFLHQLEPQSAFYNVPVAVRLRGQLDTRALAQTFTEIIRRHEILRTIFTDADGQLVQFIHDPAPFSLPVIDLSALPEAERDGEARRLAREQAHLPFDLSTGPLLRVSLLRLSENEHVLISVMHHIISDGWSLGVLVREVAALYEAYRQGAQSPLQELPIQYADYAVWQREWLQGAALEEQLSYWREQLAGAPPVLALPTDRVRPAVQSYQGDSLYSGLSAELSEQVRELSRREGVTVFMTLLAAFQILLWRYTSERDVVVGTPIAGRGRRETEGLIGFFVNTLVLRTELRGEGDFREALRRVREVTLGAYAHQDVPFERLVEDLQPERSLSHAPLFQIMFVMQELPQDELKLGATPLERIEVESAEAKFDLTLTATESAEGLRLSWNYSTDLFDGTTIEQMGRHFEKVVEAVVSTPEQRLSEIRLLSGDEREQLLVQWNERIDQQVKVRGYRIELGEIEAALRAHPAVSEVAAIVREDVAEEKRLVAYVVTEEGHELSSTELRSVVGRKLPAYMIPTAFVMMKELPRTPDGKLDRRALPKPEEADGELTDTLVLARTPIEEMLAQLWADVLHIECVDVRANFFDLGGHSLQAARLISKVRDVFKVEVPLRALFEAPTVAAFAERMWTQPSTDESAPLVPVRSAEGPLSFAQQRLWFLDQLEIGSAFYNIPSAFRLSGPLNVSALEQTFSEITSRHEILRTHFDVVDGHPVQIVSPARPVSLALTDLRTMDKVEREAEALRLAEEEAQRPFQLSAGPLMRASLLRLDAEEHLLLVTMHHIISDAWSNNVLMSEVSTLYEAFSRGVPSPLPPLPVQYADFALWQRRWLTGEVLQSQMEYWKQQLAGAPPMLELPSDRPRPPVQSHRGARHSFVLPRDLTESLKRLSRQENVTLFMTLMAAFQTLLYRYTHETDVLVGTPVAGRNRSEVERLIGFFVSTLVLRTNFSGNPDFRSLLKKVRETTLEAYSRQDLPFEHLVEELQPERDLSRSPIFQIMFALNNAERATTQLTDLTINQIPVGSGTARFDLTVVMDDSGSELRGECEYNLDLFDATTISRLTEHFEILLSAIVAAPDTRVAELHLLTEVEHHKLLAEWNDTQREIRQSLCLHEMFEGQVARTPDSIAVMMGAEQLSYHELNSRANQLAHYLRRRGVRADTPVGILLERSPEMMVALVGILKAGGAYVPLDPAYPKERLAFMLRDTHAPVLVTQERLADLLTNHEAEIVCIDRDWEAIAQEINEDPPGEATPDSLAYILYTSGSTGKPKGSALHHGALANLILWQLENSSPAGGARTLQFTSLSFDVSCQEIFSTWCGGGTLTLISEEARQDARELLLLIKEQAVERLFLPFVSLQQLAEVAHATNLFPTSLREVITAGEQLKVTRQLAEFFEKLEGCVLHNQYGPSECHVVSAYSLTGAPGGWPVLPPIGRPIANARLYVVDEFLQPVPIGVSGELLIAGACVGRGYFRRPELTAEQFPPDSFGTEAGARMYRTGDRARYLPDGNIEFLGRLDHQVKVRGYRIEVGEIETALAAHAAVEDVAVTAHDYAPGQKRLAAYIVFKEEHAPTHAELRGFLKERLPEYMIPSAFIRMAHLPLLPSGKVNRRALPAPDQGRPDLGAYVAPRTPTEEILKSIWADVLKIDEVSIADNFFELGGHSLLATQVVARVREVFRVELPLRSLFEEPTIEGLAGRLDSLKGQGTKLPVSPVVRVSEEQLLPMSFAQQRQWFIYQLDAGSAFYNIPGAIRLRGRLNVKALEQSFTEIVRRHDVLRAAFTEVDGTPAHTIAPPYAVSLPLINFETYTEDEREARLQKLMATEATQPFDLSQGSAWRALLARLDEDEHVLFMTMHHIISDGWSISVLFDEMAALYDAYSSGRPSPLAELPLQYVDYAFWQREQLQGELLESQLAYWKQQLNGAPPVIQLPTDHPRPPVQSFRGAAVRFEVEEDCTAGLKSLSRRVGATLFMTLLAAFNVLLHRYTGEHDISVGTPIAGRGHADLEKLVGLFINTLVLRTDLSGDPSFQELLRRVREVCLGAYAHQDVPFEKLIEDLQVKRNLSHTPLFQVMFMMQSTPAAETEASGLQMKITSPEIGAGRFDLTLVLREADGGLEGAFDYSTDLFERETVERMVGHFKELLRGVAADSEREISALPMLTGQERKQLLKDWNDTARPYPALACVHHLFEEQARSTPHAVAVICEGEQATYDELNERANKVARHLGSRGVGAGARVGILCERSIEMVVGLLGILKAGGAYVPLDPEFPTERLSYMLSDAEVSALLTQSSLAQGLRDYDGRVICLDAEAKEIDLESPARPASDVSADDLAYVMYTSGSTGQPKGVMVCHRNVVNFFTAMDERVHGETAGTLLALTSISFDISVLELLWTLTRGFRVVIQKEQYETARAVETAPEAADKEIEFSLFYFASDDEESPADSYRLLLEGARYADQHGFTAVWTPERHFHAFGGLYPNPSVTGAALAAITERVQIRAGSVVLPLHNPIRVAEEWSVVDNLSKGRVAISFASGWHADDFVFAPDKYANRKEIMLRDIETVRRLWRGEAVTARGGTGNEVEIKIRPRPVQRELPIWLTAAGNPETFRLAGETGANLLTHLLGQTVEELQRNIQIYRQACRSRGFDGKVTLMLHTFVGPDLEEVKEKVRGPFTNYLSSSFDLIKNLARSLGNDIASEGLTEEAMDSLRAVAFDRYFETSGLMGTPRTCMQMIDRLRAVGVDEIGCLIDFGVDAEAVISSLPFLNLLKEQCNEKKDGRDTDYSIPAQIKRHDVTHLQCTPSMARIISTDETSLDLLASVPTLMLGGEALPVPLARQLRSGAKGELHNMYGPTETTIWSATHRVDTVAEMIPLGRPVANTEIYILDRHLQPLPVGIPGELFIGGAGVVRGYWQRPDLTAEKFVPDPFGGTAGARLYRTGDHARFMADGNIEFLGRLDRQVKLRGYRVEVGEIEAILGQYPGVREVVVAAREDAFGDKHLVAYVVSDRGDTTGDNSPSAEFDKERLPDGQPFVRLANGMTVAYVSAIHAHAAYKEIFEEDVYLKHGITLNDDACIFDVGANIGMFTLYASRKCKNPTIYAFEPIPAIFKVLQSNVNLHGVNAKLYECGVSDSSGEDLFTFYPELPGLSGRYSNAESNKQTALSLIYQNGGMPRHLLETLDQSELDEALKQRFRSDTYTCRLRTLSDIIQENKVERIDLLKVDVEKSEMDVLAGIREEDWKKIKQIVLEVDTTELLQQITTLLDRQGYDYTVDEVLGAEGNGGGADVHVYMLYAVSRAEISSRESGMTALSLPVESSNGHDPSVSALRSYLKEKLPEYMVPSSYVFMKALPRTPNGKIDVAALPDPDGMRPSLQTEYVAPRNEAEMMVAGAWRELLQLESIGIHDNFFEVGGTSLLLLRLRNRLQELSGKTIPIIEMLRHPTIVALANHIGDARAKTLSLDKIQDRASKNIESRNQQKQLMEQRRKSKRKPGRGRE